MTDTERCVCFSMFALPSQLFRGVVAMIWGNSSRDWPKSPCLSKLKRKALDLLDKDFKSLWSIFRILKALDPTSGYWKPLIQLPDLFHLWTFRQKGSNPLIQLHQFAIPWSSRECEVPWAILWKSLLLSRLSRNPKYSYIQKSKSYSSSHFHCLIDGPRNSTIICCVHNMALHLSPMVCLPQLYAFAHSLQSKH
jgi:hypothetical protein